MIRTPAITFAALAVLSLGACGFQTAQVEPGSGSAGSASTSSGSADADATTAKFGQKFTYPDGVEVEVTNIETAKTKAYALVGEKEAKKGTAYTQLSVRVRNGGKDTLDAVGSTQMHYGPDGDEAPVVYDDPVPSEITGKIVKGKAKTGVYGYVVPSKYHDDVQFEFTMDFEHDAVVFSGKL